MKKIFSSLEPNYIKGVLINKGENLITDKDFQILQSSPVFNNYLKYKHIFLIETPSLYIESLDFESMTQPQLKDYVLKNNIEVPSFKKVDMLEVLKNTEKN